MASGEAAAARLCDRTAEVSCHYLVWEDGTVDQMVAEADRAWHAGRSSWAGESDLNSVSIGIEIVNGGHEHGCPPYPPAQIAAVVALCRDVCERRGLARSRVLAHSDVAPDRKLDPGEHFPWRTLAAAGIGLWPEPEADGSAVQALSVDDIQARLTAVGYDCPRTARLDTATREALAAFQRRWRPALVDGHPDAETIRLLVALRALS